MFSRPSLAGLSLCLSAAPALAQDDAARLVPPNSSVLVRLESLRAWNELVRGFAPLGDEELANYDLQAVLDGAKWDQDVEEWSAPQLDPTRPLFLALALDPTRGPQPVMVAPATDGRPFRFFAELAGGKETNARLGDYTGVALLDPTYAASATPSPLLTQLRPGLVSAHVDLAALIAAYRPLIDMGLRQAEMMLDQLPSAEAGMDVQAVMELYLGMVRSMLDSAQTLDLALEREGDELAVRFDYQESAERLPGMHTAEVLQLLGHVDPDSSVQAAFNGSWVDLLGWLEDFSDTVLDAYPEPLRTDFRQLMALQKELAPLLEPGMAAGVDFTPEGVHAEYALRSKQAAEVVTRFEAQVRALDRLDGLLRVGASERLVVDGMEARVLPLELHFESLGAMFENMAGGQELDPAAKQQIQETLATLYGRNLRLALASHGDVVLMAVANNDGALRTDLARLLEPDAPAPKMLRLLQRIEPGAAGFAYHLDLGQALGQMIDAFHGLFPWATFFPRVEASIDTWGSLRGGHWAGGMGLSLAELIELGRAVQGLEPK